MLKKIFIFLLMIVGGKLYAQYPGFKLMTDTNDFRNQFIKTVQEITTIKSDFIQEKNLSMLSEKISSTGIFWFKKENMLRMEYLKPFQYLMIINKNNVMLKDAEKTNIISIRSNKLFQQISQIMLDCVQGTVLINPKYKIIIFENKTNWMIEMDPFEKGLKDFFKTINIIIDKKDYSVTSVNMVELTGDNTLIRFKNREVNIEIPDAVFSVN